MTRRSVVAIIPARAGSRGIPGKCRKMLLGKPLITYTIRAALQAEYVDEIVVTTDDDMIKEMAKAFHIDVIDRPSRLATARARVEAAVAHCLHALQEKKRIFEYLLLLQPTSPLRTALHIDDCCKTFFTSENNSAVSITESAHHPYKTFLVKNKSLLPLGDRRLLGAPRQQLPASFCQNGAIYLLSVENFLREKSFIVEPFMGYKMKREESIDIDTELDFRVAEMLMSASASTGIGT